MNPSPISLHHFEPTRQAALARLNEFLPYAGSHYAKHRNTDYGASGEPGVSGLSPYLRYRVITEAEVMARVLEAHSLQSAEKFIQEVVWRTYWKGWLQMRPNVWTQYGQQLGGWLEKMTTDTDLASRYQQAIEGRAGIDGFDDWAKDLVETGYLHNHARMWFASIWVFTLRLPWELGADFFLTHLLDGDPASNTLSWRWVAGIQTPGKTYLATKDNIERFTQGRYSPKGLASEAIPITAPPAPLAQGLIARPKPMEALSQPSVWLVHSNDIEIVQQARANPNCCGVIWYQPESPCIATRVGDFISQAMDDQKQPDEELTKALNPDELADKVAALGGKQLVVCEPPVGSHTSAVDLLSDLCPLPVLQVRRAYDDALWPAATKGFFPFKQQVLTAASLTKAIA